MELRVDCVNMFFNKGPRKLSGELKTRFPQQRNTYRNSDLRHSLKRKNHGNFKEPNQKKFRDKQYIIRAICSDEICKETAEQAKSLEIKLEVAQRRIEVMHKRLCIVQNMLLEKLNSEMYDESPPQSPSNLNLSFSSETSSSSEFIILKKERLDSIDELDISSIVKAEVVKIEDLQID